MKIFNQNKKTIFLLALLAFLIIFLYIISNVFPKKTVPPLSTPPSAVPQGSLETSKEAENITTNYYPLAPYKLPAKANFYFEYLDRLKLKVYLIGDKISSQKEFEDWAKEKGVDLSTHQVQYLTPP